MTDFATTNTTEAIPVPSLVGTLWEQNAGQFFGPEMKGSGRPVTPPLGGAGGPRPTMGLIFPRGT